MSTLLQFNVIEKFINHFQLCNPRHIKLIAVIYRVFVIFWVNWQKNSWSDKEILLRMQEIVCIYDKVPKYIVQFSSVFTRIEIQNALQSCLVVPKIGFYIK